MLQRPDYSRSIYNIPHTILQILGIKDENALRELKDMEAEKIALILVDGMGENIYSKSNMLKNSTHLTLNSVFPSTTAAALTTFLTGLSPKEHGILEFRMYYEICELIIKTLPFSPLNATENDALIKMGCSPKQLFSLPTIFSKLRREEISSCGLLRKEYYNASYSRFLFRGARRVPYTTIEEAFRIISQLKEDFIFLYLDHLDTEEHVSGPHSSQSLQLINRILAESERLKKRVKNRLIIITADHGLIEIKKKRIIPDPSIEDKIGGSPRDVFLYGPEIQEIYKGMTILSKDSLIHQGFLGPEDAHMHLALHYRLPEKILLPKDAETLWYRPFRGKGLHGGLSKEEMLVPLLVLK